MTKNGTPSSSWSTRYSNTSVLVNTWVKTFAQFLLEYPINDIRYFKELPDTQPDADVLAAQKKYGFEGLLKWKTVKNRSFTHSREMDDGIIGMVSGDIEENWFHELGHELYDHCDKDSVKPLLDRIREAYGKGRHESLKWLELGGYEYSYSHSGKEFEYDELFAISFAFVEGDEGKFEDPAIDKDFRAMLKTLQDKPLFNPNPYSDHDSKDKA